MKRGLKWLLALAMLLMMLCPAAALADTLRFGTVDSASTVNLRAGASTSTQKLGEYRKGTWLRITGESGNWYKVTGPDGMSGYMSKDYVYVSAAAKGIIGVVDVKDSLTLRASPSTASRALGNYKDGTPCILLSESGSWYHVTVDGKSGYFAASYIDKLYTTYSPDVATVVSRNGGAVNLRKGPGTQYAAIKSVKTGSYVMIIQEGRDWWKISVDGYVGFMDTDFLKDGVVGVTSGGSSSGSSSGGSSSGGSSSSGTGAYATVNNPGANEKLHLRKSASRASQSLGLYGNGVRVTVLDQGNTWCKVSVNGTVGYMMTRFLKFHGINGSAAMQVDHPDRTFVYLRSGPSQSTGKVLMKVSHGKWVTILTPGSTWTKVSYNDTVGYMMTRFLSK